MKTRSLFLLLGVLYTIIIASCSKAELFIPAPVDNTKEPEASVPVLVNNINKDTLLFLINQYRQAGCNCGTTAMPPVPPLEWNAKLEYAATKHSQEMQSHNYFSHTGKNGSSPSARVTQAGYIWRATGENIASGYRNERDVIAGWIQSVTHCKNIMSANFTEVGVGRAGNYWTQVFGAPRSN
jgi:uncharacterized protein YkwD